MQESTIETYERITNKEGTFTPFQREDILFTHINTEYSIYKKKYDYKQYDRRRMSQ